MADRALSVVVCTHDRPDDLERCLQALSEQTSEVEVIVVDSASEPPCRDVVERFKGVIERLTYCFEPDPGLSRARNRGVSVASEGVVAFVDDDAAPAPDWADRIGRPFADLQVACVGGTCRPVFEQPPPPWLSSRLLQFAGITRLGAEAREARSSAEYPFGANMAFRREGLVALGGFPESLGRIGSSLLSGEEYEVIERLRRRGGRVWLEPDAVVDHRVAPERCQPGYYWRRLWWQGVSRARARRSAKLGLRLMAAAPARFALWPLTRDRFYLYRTAETAGYLAECVRWRSAPA